MGCTGHTKNFVANSAQTHILRNSNKSREQVALSNHKIRQLWTFSAKHTAYQVLTGKIFPPKSYKQPVLGEWFQDAIGTEVLALEDNKTWDTIDLTPG